MNPFALNTIILFPLSKKNIKKKPETNLLIQSSNKNSSVISSTVMKFMGDKPEINNHNNIGSKNKAFYLK